MNAIATKVAFEILATTRDECITKMDEIGMEFLNFVGGAPWVAVDDDFTKIKLVQPASMADDQGMAYQGRRTYLFNGPALSDLTQPQNDGFRVQKGVNNGD